MALFNKPKKMIKGTLATSKIPMSKESLAPGEGQGPEIDINPSDGTQPMWNAPVKNEPMPSFNKPEEYMPKALSNPSVVAPVVKAPAVAPVKEAPLSSMLTHEVYTKLTGKPWSTAKKEGLTDGSAASNLKLKAMLLDKANKVSASKSTVDKPASVKLENKDIADLRKKMTTPLVKKAATPAPAVAPVATPKSIAQPKAEAKPAKPLRDLTKKTAAGAPKKSQAESNTISKDWRKWDGTGNLPVLSVDASDEEWDSYLNSPQRRRYYNSYDVQDMDTKDLSVFARRNLKEADFLNTDEQRGRFAKERELRKKQMEDEEIRRNKDVPSNTIRDTFRTPSSSKFNKVTVKKKDSGPVNAKDVAKYIRRPGLF